MEKKGERIREKKRKRGKEERYNEGERKERGIRQTEKKLGEIISIYFII